MPSRRQERIIIMCADITKCSSTTCPSRKECWRAAAPDTLHWQSYMDFKKVFGGRDRCRMFIFAAVKDGASLDGANLGGAI